MRPHTRTQCNDGKDCVQCGQGGLPAGSQASSSAASDNPDEIGHVATSANNSHNRNAASGQLDLTNGSQDKTEKRFVF